MDFNKGNNAAAAVGTSRSGSDTQDQLKSYDLEAVERKKRICSLEREIERHEIEINVNKINLSEILNKKSSLCQLNDEEKSKVNALKLQLQEKKEDLNKKFQAFNEERRNIYEIHSKLQVSFERKLEKYKTDLKYLDDIENYDLNEIENIKKSIELKKKGVETLEEEIKNINRQWFVTKRRIEFCERFKNKFIERLIFISQQQKPKKTKRKADFEDDNDTKSDNSCEVLFDDSFQE